jgi:aminoglycoside phosphotransferase (APT) family kinase protein
VARTRVTPELAARLVAAQFPHWAHLPVAPVALDGWDNTTMRLGDDLSLRFPNDDGYVPQVEKEHRWLPLLAAQLPLPIPQPVARGAPGAGFPRPWSVYRWLRGAPATPKRIDDLERFATDVAAFLDALYAVDPAGGPPAGAHSFFRGAPLAVYDSDARGAIAALDGAIDAEAAVEVWGDALARAWEGPPVWVHGDVTGANLLVVGGRLSAVLDFGCSSVGDPACDLAIAWTFFHGRSREAFRDRLGLDDAAWARGRGWALWKAAITCRDPDPEGASARFGWRVGALRVLEDVLANA